MSRRRDAVERAFEREEDALSDQYDRGLMTPQEYNAAMRELQREAQYEARAAMEEDMQDVKDDWR